MTQWEKLLRSLGFSESEANIYLLSLEMGPSAVQDIAKRADVSRVTTYAVVESLMQDGLMSTVQKGKKNLYVAESPERLISFVNSRVKTMEATLREIEQALPDLRLLQRGDKPVVKLLEGIEGLRSLYEDIIKTSPKNPMEVGNIEDIAAIFSHEQMEPYREQIGRLKMGGRILYCGQLPHKQRDGLESRHISHDKVFFHGDILIYKHKTAFSTFKGKLVTVIVESDVIAETMRGLFELAWHSALIENGKK
ncbi:MAG: helix-turn-helix domain-containing protein [Patescibacteria group bacterium]